MVLEGDGYVGGPAAGEAEWDVENIRGPKRAPKKDAQKAISVQVGSVVFSLTKTGTCKVCGEPIAYSRNHTMWLHVERLKGNKRYTHEGRPR